jgi:hypothetical protein
VGPRIEQLPGDKWLEVGAPLQPLGPHGLNQATHGHGVVLQISHKTL